MSIDNPDDVVIDDPTIYSGTMYAQQIQQYNHTLQTLGILQDATLKLDGSSDDCATVLHVISSLITLCDVHVRDIHTHDNTIQQLNHTLNIHTAKINSLQNTINDTEKRAWEIELKRRSIEQNSVQMEKKLKTSYSELERKYTILQRKDNTWKHQIRKIETDHQKLVEKYSKLVHVSDVKSKSSFEVYEHGKSMHIHTTTQQQNNMQQNATNRPKTATKPLKQSTLPSNVNSGIYISREEIDVQSRHIYHIQAQLQSALNENHALRDSIKVFEETLHTHEVQHGESGRVGKSIDCDDIISSLREFTPAHLHMPYSGHTHQNIQSSIMERIHALKQQITQIDGIEDATRSLCDDDEIMNLVNTLRDKINIQAQLLTEQDQFIQHQIVQQQQSQNDSINTSATDNSVFASPVFRGHEHKVSAVIDIEHERATTRQQQRIMQDNTYQIIEKLRLLQVADTSKQISNADLIQQLIDVFEHMNSGDSSSMTLSPLDHKHALAANLFSPHTAAALTANTTSPYVHKHGQQSHIPAYTNDEY